MHLSDGWLSVIAFALCCAVVVEVANKRLKNKKSSPYPLPPGPPALPIVGNIRGVNADAPWLTYMDWGKSYGDLIYARFFHQDIIIINSERVARDLLDDRSSNYSDRPFLITNKLFGCDFNTIFMTYGDRWRRQRSFFHQSFKADAVSRFKPIQQEKAHQLLCNLLASPDLCRDHLFYYTSSIILKAVYDYDATHRNDELVVKIEKAVNIMVNALQPEAAAMLTAFPKLVHFPLWLPSFTIKRNAAITRKLLVESTEVPFKHAIRRLGESSTSPTMVFDGLRKAKGKDVEWVQALKDASASGFLAASETSYSVLTSFMLAMVLFPEVQTKAQAEIDSVCGKGRLPTLEDRPSLTYIDAIMRETLRWAPVAPLSIPHKMVDDDVYNGYYIPKGATVMPNIWAMSRNEEKYPKASEFTPERFLDSDGQLTDDNVVNIAFGYGRRICVGRYFAENSMWFAMSMILAVFKLSAPKGEDGHEVPIEPKWTNGVTRHPQPFPINIVPRIHDLDVEKLDEMFGTST
ncbi:cytochrome P450 [Phlebopus sp. FC_14]|nr:cytochrome P450 [Phlebopus sp. FC_14]